MKMLLRFFLCFSFIGAIVGSGSWDSYIDKIVAQSKDDSGTAHCDKAAIIGLNGGASWTTEGHVNALKLSAEEGANIAKCFKSKDFTDFTLDGVTAEDIDYNIFRMEDDKLVLAKKKGSGALSLQASQTAIVIGHTSEGGLQDNVNKAIDAIAAYLESLGM